MKRLVVFVGLMSAFLGLALSTGALAASERFFTTQLTQNDFAWSCEPQVSGDRVVWSGYDGTDTEIYTWTPTGGTVRLTSNRYDDNSPQVSGDRVVWYGSDAADPEVFTWTPATGTVKLTSNGYSDTAPHVSGDRVVWCGYDAENVRSVFTWTPTGGTVQITSDSFCDWDPEISGDRVVWKTSGEAGTDGSPGIFTWTPTGGTVQLTTNGAYDGHPQVSGDRVVWRSYDGSDIEIFTWTPAGGTVKLTSNDYYDDDPQVSGDRVVWRGQEGLDGEVFTWTPSSGAIQITSNGYQDDWPQVSGDRIVWAGYDGAHGEIFAWSPVDGTVRLTYNSRDDGGPEVSGDRVVWMGNDGSDFEVFTAIAGPVGAFTDVGPDTHYKDAIEAMAGAGVIRGFPDGTFRPDQPVTRQQFAKMIVKTLGLEVTGNEPCPFRDVGRNMDPADPNYPRQYVAVCAQEGITVGKTSTTFAPYANITRAQLLTMVVRGAALFAVLDAPTPAYYQGTSEGTHQFRAWVDANHAFNAQTAEFNGLLEGIVPDDSSGLVWNPYESATRGEVAQILWRLWQRISSSSMGREIRIGFVTPLTGPLAVFGVTDQYCVDRWRELCGDGLLLRDGKLHRVTFVVRDSQSDANRAAQVTDELVRDARVDMVLVGSRPETVNPVADICEYLGVPCISTDALWQQYFFGRGGDPTGGFKWTYHYFWGAEDVVAAYLDLWSQVPTNKVVGALWPNDAEGWVFRQSFTPVLTDAGYELIDPGAFQPGSEDFTSIIAQFKNVGVEIVTGVMTPPDFNNFWVQCKQQGFNPKIATMSQALRFPQTLEAIGDIGVGLTTEMAWSPGFPFVSSLTGEKAEHLAADFEARTGVQWSQILMHYALGEIAIDALKRAQDPKDKESILEALRTTKLETSAGAVDFTSPVAEGTLHPVPNVYKSPVAGGQWVKGTVRPYDVRIVGNAAAPMVPVQGPMQPLP